MTEQLELEVSIPADDLVLFVYHLTVTVGAFFFLHSFGFHATVYLETGVISVFHSSFCTSQNTVVSELCPSCIFSQIETLTERKPFICFRKESCQISLHIWSLSP